MVFRYLLVVSETFYDWNVHLKKEDAKFYLAIACFVLVF